MDLLLLDDDDYEIVAFMYGTYECAMHLDKYYNRCPYRVPSLSGLEWVQQKFADANACYNIFRMTPDLFFRLHAFYCQLAMG